LRLIICDVCGTEERSRSHDYLGKDFTWIVVEANEDADHAQLCSWSCLASWAISMAVERENYVLTVEDANTDADPS